MSKTNDKLKPITVLAISGAAISFGIACFVIGKSLQDDSVLASSLMFLGGSLAGAVMFSLIHWFVLANFEDVKREEMLDAFRAESQQREISTVKQVHCFVDERLRDESSLTRQTTEQLGISVKKMGTDLAGRIDSETREVNDCLIEAAGTIERLNEQVRELTARQETVSETLKEEFEVFKMMVEARREFGFDRMVPHMDFAQLFRDLQEGDELWFLDTYVPNHDEWIDELVNAIRRGAIIKMLVLKPNSKAAKDRAIEIPELDFARELKEFIKAMRERTQTYDNSKGRLEIVEYKDLPCAPLYIVVRDNRPLFGYSSYFFNAPTGISFPHIRWECSKVPKLEVLGSMLDFVHEKWQRNRSAPTREQTPEIQPVSRNKARAR